jgi:hypothetical protein
MWELVDQFYVLCVKDSPRIDEVKIQVDYFNIPKDKLTWNIVPRLNYKGDKYGSQVENHILAYKDAYSKGYQNIIVFEDDIYIFGNENTINEKINTINDKVFYFIKNYKEYDMLYFGSIPFYIDSFSDDNGIVKCHSTSIQAYLISKDFYSIFLNIDIENKILTCMPYMKVMLDYWIYCISTHRDKSYCLKEMIVLQNNFPGIPNWRHGKYLFKIICELLIFIHYNKYYIILVFSLLILLVWILL